MYLLIFKNNFVRLVLAFIVGLLFCTATIGQESSLPGVVTATRTAELSTGVSQTLTQIKVRPGEFVKKGDLLAVLNPKIAQAEYAAAAAVANSSASTDLARIGVKEAKSRLERTLNALQRGAANDMEVAQAKDEYNKAVAALKITLDTLEQARQTAELSKQRLELYHIRAPFDGQVDRIYVRVGNFIAGDTPLISLVSSEELQVELHLPIERFGQLTVGNDYQLTAEAPLNRNVTARLQYVSPNVDAASGTFYCLFTIENVQRTLPAGFSVQLKNQSTEDTQHVVYGN